MRQIALFIVLMSLVSACETLFNQERETLIRSGEIQKVGVSGATVAGVLLDVAASDNNPVITFGHCWATQDNPSIEDFRTDLGVPTRGTNFSSDLRNLIEGTTYYVRAYAQTESGVEYGGVLRFTPGLVRTNAVYNIGGGEAFASATLNSNTAEIVLFGHCWAKNKIPTLNDARSEYNNPDEYLPDLRFESQLAGLEPSSTYYLRGYAITPDGVVVYGGLFLFETPEE